jgi:hypothetical protein
MHNEELHSMYSSPHIIRVTKLQSMRHDRHAAHTYEDER